MMMEMMIMMMMILKIHVFLQAINTLFFPFLAAINQEFKTFRALTSASSSPPSTPSKLTPLPPQKKTLSHPHAPAPCLAAASPH